MTPEDRAERLLAEHPIQYAVGAKHHSPAQAVAAIAAAIRAAVAAERELLQAQYRTSLATFERAQDAFGETCAEVAAAVRAEREACADVLDGMADAHPNEACDDALREAAAAIRARGEAP